jgi:citrate synthase
MGFGHRVYKSYDPRAEGDQEDRRPRLRGDRQEPAARDRARARADRAAGRILRHQEAVSERRLLLRPHLPAMGFPMEMFPVLFAIPRTAGWIAPVGGDAARSRSEDRPAAPDLHRTAAARLRPREKRS